MLDDNGAGLLDGMIPVGRPSFVPTDGERLLAQELSGFGVPQEQIAALIRGGICVDTLRKCFPRELAEGRAKANVEIGRRLWSKAMSGDTACLIWWTKSQMRWREEVNQQHASPVTINLAWLPNREVDASANRMAVSQGEVELLANTGLTGEESGH